MGRQGPRCSSRCPRSSMNRSQYATSVKLRLKSRHRIATRTTHRANGGVRSGHQTLKPHPRTSGRSMKSSSGQATSQAEVLSCASTASIARGNPIGSATIVPTVKTTSSAVAMLTSAFANRARMGANGIPAHSAATQNPTLISPGMDDAIVSR